MIYLIQTSTYCMGALNLFYDAFQLLVAIVRLCLMHAWGNILNHHVARIISSSVLILFIILGIQKVVLYYLTRCTMATHQLLRVNVNLFKSQFAILPLNNCVTFYYSVQRYFIPFYNLI